MSQTLPVLVETWQFECCGDSFAVGDEVSWRLSLVTADLPIRVARTTVQGVIGAELTSDASGDSGSVLTAGSLVAWVRPVQRTGPAELQGTFVEDHHGMVPEELAVTRGRIERIRAVSVAYRRENAELLPLPGSERLRDIAGSADWAALPTGDSARQEGELLVDLLINEATAVGT